MFNTKFSTKDSQSYYNYYNDIAKRVKNKQIDMLLVVNMFLTGFDSKPLNTLYVDKNLQYHGLIQAYSRTNRILNEQKSQGNIVAFRNLKNATDEAIALFSNKDAKEIIIMHPYEDYIEDFNQALEKLYKISPTVDSVNDLPSETEELDFVKAFRVLMRIKNVMSTYSDFSFDDIGMHEQQFEDYKSKYLDIYDKYKRGTVVEKVSILDDVDFELELIVRDEINVAYILNLLRKLQGANKEEIEKGRKTISDIVKGNPELRSKKELIEKFIEENLIGLKPEDDFDLEFETFWDKEREAAIKKLSQEENIELGALQQIIDNYLFSEKPIERDDVIEGMKVKPKILERKKVSMRIIDKMMKFIDTFLTGVAA